MTTSYYTNRKITVEECPWLEEDVEKETMCYEFKTSFSTNVCGSGKMVTFDPDGLMTPAVELPYDALTKHAEVSMFQIAAEKVTKNLNVFCRLEDL